MTAWYGGLSLLLPVAVRRSGFHRLKLQSCPGMVPIIWSSVAGKPKLPRRGLMFHQRYHNHLAMLCFGQAPASVSRLVVSDCIM